MKTYIANIIAAMILVACSGNKTSEATEPIADKGQSADTVEIKACLLYTSPSPRDRKPSRMPSSA